MQYKRGFNQEIWGVPPRLPCAVIGNAVKHFQQQTNEEQKMSNGKLKLGCQLCFAISSTAFVSHFGRASKATTLANMPSCTPSYAFMSDLNTFTENLLLCESLHTHPPASAMGRIGNSICVTALNRWKILVSMSQLLSFCVFPVIAAML